MLKSRLTALLPLLLSLALSAGCEAPSSPAETSDGGTIEADGGAADSSLNGGAALPFLRPPTGDAQAAAQSLHQSFPGARITFAQRTGDILVIDGGGTALATGTTDSAAHALAVVQSFLRQYPNALRIADPDAELIAGDDDFHPLSQGVASVHFRQLQQNVPISGRYGAAWFNGAGQLLALQVHLLPTAAFTATSASATLAQTRRLSRAAAQAPAPSSARPGTRRVWAEAPAGTAAAGQFRLVDEEVTRDGVEVTRRLRDAATGELLATYDETAADLATAPTGWFKQPPVTMDAPDARGNPVAILTTAVPANGNQPATLVMGFNLPGVQARDQVVSIGDAHAQATHAAIPTHPIATTAASWGADPAYAGSDADATGLRAATTLAAHLRTAMLWYQSNLSWASWDGKGTTFFAGIRGNRSADGAPELNAWGGGGGMMIGDGFTVTGQPLSDALDIVAHEFTHSVISATTALQYLGESGALNESLADFMGKTVQGFPDMSMGTDAGVRFRDLGDPAHCVPLPGGDVTDCIQPARYGDFRIIPSNTDAGGVHTNSGILNRALTQTLAGLPGPDNAARGLALGSLILDALRYAGLDTQLTMEDFAANLLGYCRMRERAGSLGSGLAGGCAALESAFRDGQLLTAAQ